MRYQNISNQLITSKRFKLEISLLLAFLLMWILFGWNTGNADYENYFYIYNAIGQYGVYSAVEIGFDLICKICNLLGLNYNGFLIIYSFIGLILIVSTAKRFTNNSTLTLILYFIYPFMLDVVQIRNFMSMALIIFATRYLVTDRKKDYIKFLLFVLLASTFHYSALFYILFLLVRIKSYRKIIYITLILVVLGILTCSKLPSVFYLFLNKNRYESYFSFSTSSYAQILFLFYLVASILLVYFVYKKVKKRSELESGNCDEYKNKSQLAFADVVLKINIIVSISYVFLLIDVDFIRLYRNILILNYILFSMIKSKGRYTKSANTLVHSWLFIAFVVLSSWAFIFLETYQSVVIPIFNKNTFLQLF